MSNTPANTLLLEASKLYTTQETHLSHYELINLLLFPLQSTRRSHLTSIQPGQPFDTPTA
jgi:hypothetical protein